MRFAVLLALMPLIACVDAGSIPTSGKRGAEMASPGAAPEPIQMSAQQQAMNDFARGFLNELQPASFANGVEYCGYILQDQSGAFLTTGPARGTEDSCEHDYSGHLEIVASYHTHGTFGYDYDNEVPSVTDLEGDFYNEVDGYIATPGGRLWLVDYETRRAIMLCGASCILPDPGYVVTDDATLRSSYTIAQLRQRANSY